MTETNTNPNMQSEAHSSTSKEILYLSHILETMKQSMTCFKSKDVEEFELYVSYLEASILSDDVRQDILKEQSELIKKLKAQQTASGGVPTNTTIRFKVGFITIRKIFIYLNSICEFETEDILGEISKTYLPSVEE
jgi:hypothetical protein